MDTQSHLDQLTRIERQVRMRTFLSIGLFVVFVITSTTASLMLLSLWDPIIVVALVAAVLSFGVLPREYLPLKFSRRSLHSFSEEEEFQVVRIKKQERLGMILRAIYFVIAIITVGILRQLVA